MPLSPLAGKPAPADLLIDVERLVGAYYTRKPDPGDPQQLVSFGTSGHRGTAENATFTEAHILAITQAICDYRRQAGLIGPVFVGIDTHGLAEPALVSAIEVFAANSACAAETTSSTVMVEPASSHAFGWASADRAAVNASTLSASAHHAWE